MDTVHSYQAKRTASSHEQLKFTVASGVFSTVSESGKTA